MEQNEHEKMKIKIEDEKIKIKIDEIEKEMEKVKTKQDEMEKRLKFLSRYNECVQCNNLFVVIRFCWKCGNRICSGCATIHNYSESIKQYFCNNCT
jgi:hypothetical protein